jgi:16S rRNA (guanine966-N2)-methyltransferase
MRIIAGSRRGMRLLGPKGFNSRPITDRIKESLFNVLFNYDLPAGCQVADLFCGAGSLGLEVLSRKAEFVTFVEQDPKVIAILNRNIEKAGFVKESKVIRANAFKIGAPIDSQGKRYGLVFVDPPYADTQKVQEGSRLSELFFLLQGQMSEQGIVMVRTQQGVFLMERYGQFQVLERREWGTMVVTILQKMGQ